MKTHIDPDHIQDALLTLSAFLGGKQSTLFRIRLTAESEVRWDEATLWQLRTMSPDGKSREAIFPSIEGIIVRCTPPPSHAFASVLMCNLLLPWQAVIEPMQEALTISLGKKAITFIQWPLLFPREEK